MLMWEGEATLYMMTFLMSNSPMHFITLMNFATEMENQQCFLGLFICFIKFRGCPSHSQSNACV